MDTTGANSTSLLDRRQKQVRRRRKSTWISPDHTRRKQGKRKRQTDHSVNPVRSQQGEGHQTVKTRNPSTDPQRDVVPGDADFNGIRNSHRISTANEVVSHLREQNSQQRRPKDLVCHRSPSREHQDRSVARAQRTRHSTSGAPEKDHLTNP